jgi:hypothetical protein
LGFVLGIREMEDNSVLNRYVLKEIDVIQNIIKRMASTSFLIKGWTITLVIATLLLRGTKYQVLIAFIPLGLFWYLDTYFLWQERMYKKLYEWVIKNRLKTDEHLFDMNAYRFRDKVQSRLSIMFSITLVWFYGSIAVLLAIYLIFLFLP